MVDVDVVGAEPPQAESIALKIASRDGPVSPGPIMPRTF
jgi:hypothetical protein